MDTLKPLSINLHLTESCNMNCHACFAKYERSECGFPDWIAILEVIARETSGLYTAKLSFAGGEPTLLPYLPSLVRRAKAMGFITSIITNGTRLTDEYVQKFDGCLDWIGISIDSLSPEINRVLGRTVGGTPLSRAEYLAAVQAVRRAGIRLKINTVVSKPNAEDNMVDFVSEVMPDRWKIMQAIRVGGQNAESEFVEVHKRTFQAYVDRHWDGQNAFIERTQDMLGSYVMIDPSGTPYGNARGVLVVGRPILLVGLLGQLEALGYDYNATEARGGFR